MALAKRYLALCIIRRSHLPARGCASTVVVSRNLGLNAAAIGSRANLWQNRANRFDQAVLLMRSSKFKSSLDNIVCEGIAEQALHFLRTKKLFDNHVLGLGL